MGVLEEVGQKLEDLGVGTLGADLFLGNLPEAPPACAAVYETGGLAPEMGFGAPGVKIQTPGLQLVFRGAAEDYATPRARAAAAYAGLAAVQAETLSGTFFHWIHPQQEPFLMDRDESERPLIAFNVLVEKEPS